MSNNINYSNDLDKISELFRLTIALLAKHSVPVEPHNYHIGYEYVSGNNQSLVNDLNKLFEQFSPPEEQQLKDLYKQYFLQDEDFLEGIRKELQYIVSKLLEEFVDSGSKLTHYTDKLHRFADLLNTQNLPESSPEDLSKETQKVIEETHSFDLYQRRFESQLVDVMSDIDELRRELHQVRQESKLDALTGIANRKAFDVVLEKTILHSRETKEPFCLLLLDIDHFKMFNDNFGHLIGDKVLKYVAASLRRNIKGNDFVARFGGEEFVIILPATNINGGMAVAEQVRLAISSGKLTDRTTERSYGKTRISIGVTQFRASDLSDELIGRADKALYLAKNRGRNRVEKL